MKTDNRHYALKYAAIYTFITASILIAPLFVYVTYMKNVEEIKNEVELGQQAQTVIRTMERFDPSSQEYFYFPRFQSFQAGLYDGNFKPVFTLLDFKPASFDIGYNIQDDRRYVIHKLPAGRYFNADYLIVASRHSDSELIQTALMILLSIVIIVFGFSFLFLNDFARPFQRLNETLDNFIKDSMHEINTPLSIINVNVDLYKRKFASNKYLDRIKAAAKTLSTIYDDMDYLIKKNKLEYKNEPINIETFLHERVDYFREVGLLKNIEILMECDGSYMLDFNKTKLQRVIDNNLSNAIKYSYENSRITVTVKEQPNGLGLLFKDDGVGIEHPDKIFERYYRENQEKGGFGIGLNIVKKIIDDAGITLKIESELKKGTTFAYTFPPRMYFVL